MSQNTTQETDNRPELLISKDGITYSAWSNGQEVKTGDKETLAEWGNREGYRITML